MARASQTKPEWKQGLAGLSFGVSPPVVGAGRT